MTVNCASSDAPAAGRPGVARNAGLHRQCHAIEALAPSVVAAPDDHHHSADVARGVKALETLLQHINRLKRVRIPDRCGVNSAPGRGLVACL